MMTSYFAKYKGKNGVSIARKTPSGFKGVIYTPLFPSSELLYKYKSGMITENEYEEIYIKETLSKLDPFKVLQDIGEDAVLLCYEKSEDFCHRHMVAKWLMENTGIIIHEYDYNFCDYQSNNMTCSLSNNICKYSKLTCGNCGNSKKETNKQMSLFDFL